LEKYFNFKKHGGLELWIIGIMEERGKTNKDDN